MASTEKDQQTVNSPRVERRRQMSKSRLIESAMELYASRGYYSVSLEEVALKADYSRGTLYSFFTSKEHLLAEALIPCINDVSASVRECSHLNPFEAIDAIIKLYLNLWRENKNMLITMNELKDKLDEQNENHAEIKKSYSQLLYELNQFFSAISELIPLRQKNPEAAASALDAAAVPLLVALCRYDDFNVLYYQTLRAIFTKT